jgi:CubicO group peptidase (beta-lactamase class C family)
MNTMKFLAPFVLSLRRFSVVDLILKSVAPCIRSLVLMLAATGFVQASAAPNEEIAALMTALSARGQFNGAVLVAQGGKVIYRKAFGKANFQTGADFTPQTPSNLGSVTKQFTAMAIMILAERNKLQYDDPVAKYIPEFSSTTHLSKITLRHLLTHTSGMPDYGDLAIDDSGLSQQALIAAILSKDDVLSKAGQKYQYSNPAYSLLAVVVERVSGMSFGDFLEHEIFRPAGMSSTFVYDRLEKKSARSAIGYGQFGQVNDALPTQIPGDGGIYSTVDDLLKWDRALYVQKLVRQSTLAEAVTPGKVQEGRSAYGFGWNVAEDDSGKYVWHTGSHAGFRAFIERRLGPKITVILLTNRGNSRRTEINAAIQNIFAGKSYALPKQSGAEKLYMAIHDSGIQSALKMYEGLKAGSDANYDFGEPELNTLGHQLLYGDRKSSDAVAIFRLNTAEHPASSNAFDSLGEAYSQNGQKDLAIQSYQAAVKLDPANGHAASMLKRLTE